jgi:hypothetical protein
MACPLHSILAITSAVRGPIKFVEVQYAEADQVFWHANGWSVYQTVPAVRMVFPFPNEGPA